MTSRCWEAKFVIRHRAERARLMREVLVDALLGKGRFGNRVFWQPGFRPPAFAQSNRFLLRDAALIQPPRGTHPDLGRLLDQLIVADPSIATSNT